MSKVIKGAMSCGGEIKRISRSVRDLLGFEPEALTGVPATHLFRQDDAFVIGLAGSRIDKGRSQAQVFLEVRRRGGGYLRTRATIKPRFAKGGRTIDAYDFTLEPIEKAAA